jgi:hypothetical protein
MSSNEGELHKIKKKTSGWFKSNARSKISKAIETYKPRIEAAKLLPEAERKKALIVLVNQATGDRHNAIQNGANSYSDPSWAAAATVESWLFELLSGEEHGIKSVESIINELHKRA